MTSIALHELPGFESVENCGLHLRLDDCNAGVHQIGNANEFEWLLTRDSWDTICGLLEPFCVSKAQSRHQWLSGREARYGLDTSTIAVLVSSDENGRW